MNKKILLAVVVIGFVLIVCGFGLTFLGKKVDNTKTTNTTTKNEEVKIGYNMGTPDENNYKIENGKYSNTSEKIKADHSYADLTIQNAVIEIDNKEEDLANFKFTVKNNGNNSFSDLVIDFTFIFADQTRHKKSIKVGKLDAQSSVEVTDTGYFTIIGAEDYEFSYK